MMLKNSDYYLFNIGDTKFRWCDAMSQLNSQGFVAIRGLFSNDFIDELHSRVKAVMKQPSIGGSYGYYQKDYAKKLFDPLLLSGGIVDLLLNMSVIKFVEQYVKGEVVVAECNIKYDLGVNHLYFPIHTDFVPGWQVSGSDEVVLSAEDLTMPLAVGAMLYFHDTQEGAFCYAQSTHNFGKHYGYNLSNYSNKIQKKVMSKMVRVEGRQGDLVLFDDRGFHGPEQPVSVSRTTLIFDYYKLSAFGGKTKVAIPALLSDLGHLNAKQLAVLGLGVKALVPYQHNHVRSYDQSPYYRSMLKKFEKKFKNKKHSITIKNILRDLKCKIIQ